MESAKAKFEEKTISVQRLHEGRIISLREDTVTLPSGRTAKREIVEHKGAVAIVPVRADGKIVVVWQYRKPAEEVLLELPAGGLEKGEDPQECAARELMEECNLRANKLTKLFEFYLAPGYSTELMHVFLGEELEELAGTPDEDENLEIAEYSLDELMQLLDDGKIRDSKTVAGLLGYYRRVKS
jgi:ADP-ribose pyrophosphatase